MTGARVLLAGCAPPTVDALRAVLGREPGVEVLSVVDSFHALSLIRTERPALVVAAGRVAREIAHALRGAPPASVPLLVAMRDLADPSAAGVVTEADYDARRALEPDEALAWFAVARRIRTDTERLGAAGEEIERLRDALSQSEETRFALLVSVVDLAIPGAVDRGMRIAAMARQLAERFEVPEHLLHDLEVAARLHDLGRVIAGSARRASDPSAPESERWQYTQSTVAVLRQSPDFEGAAELIANLYENWDGTGFPDHWQQGQIPLRCRILRVLIDLFAALENSGDREPETVMDWLEEHAGTRYDPLVIVHLKGLLGGVAEGDWRGSSVLVPIDELEEGMILAEDLYTASGLKLLARDTTLTPATLQIIQRRHRSEPILQGAAVLRKSA